MKETSKGRVGRNSRVSIGGSESLDIFPGLRSPYGSLSTSAAAGGWAHGSGSTGRSPLIEVPYLSYFPAFLLSTKLANLV